MKKHSRFIAKVNLTLTQTDADIDEEMLTAAAEFKVYCPKCGPKGPHLHKNGFEEVGGENCQRFQCTKCKRNFLAHTSWVPLKLAKLASEVFVKEFTREKVRAKTLAKKYGVSPSLISTLINNCQESVTRTLQNAQEGIKKVKKRLSKAGEELKVVWVDETFFRIKNESWCLILAIDDSGTPVGWHWGKKRTEEEFKKVFAQVEENVPDWNVLVGDGFSGYPKLFKDLLREGYLIQHVHSHPWTDAHLHQFSVDTKKEVFVQTTTTINYDAFTKKETQEGHVMTREFPLSPSKRPQGRPKGSKNKRKNSPDTPKKKEPSQVLQQ